MNTTDNLVESYYDNDNENNVCSYFIYMPVYIVICFIIKLLIHKNNKDLSDKFKILENIMIDIVSTHKSNINEISVELNKTNNRLFKLSKDVNDIDTKTNKLEKDILNNVV